MFGVPTPVLRRDTVSPKNELPLFFGEVSHEKLPIRSIEKVTKVETKIYCKGRGKGSLLKVKVATKHK